MVVDLFVLELGALVSIVSAFSDGGHYFIMLLHDLIAMQAFPRKHPN